MVFRFCTFSCIIVWMDSFLLFLFSLFLQLLCRFWTFWTSPLIFYSFPYFHFYNFSYGLNFFPTLYWIFYLYYYFSFTRGFKIFSKVPFLCFLLFLFCGFIVFCEDSNDNFSLLWKISDIKQREEYKRFPCSMHPETHWIVLKQIPASISFL